MKNVLLIIPQIVLSLALNAQRKNTEGPAADPFCQMIRTLYSLETVVFNSRHDMKQVFETDTIITTAKVIVKKTGTVISYLQIIPENEEKELLYCNDSAWIVYHQTHKLFCIGTRTEHLSYNYLSRFFPFSLYEVDTLISRTKPYWKVKDQTGEFSIISMQISDASKDLTDIRVEFTIGKADFMPYGTLQESVYLKADKLFQEQYFSDYTFPGPGEISIPDYYWTYEKDLSSVREMESPIDEDEEDYEDEDSTHEVFLQNIELYDLSRNPAPLPDKGLIFMDLWYIGCAPCMKSAPVVEKLYSEYKDEVHFYSVNEIDSDTAKINRFKSKMGITFPVLLGGKDKLAMKVSNNGGYPVFILLDAVSRKVIWKCVGYSENLEELVSEVINNNL